MRSYNVVYILNEHGEVLLGHKKRGVGAGNWNAPGGKIDAHESPMEAAIREVREEVGLDVKELRPGGYLIFDMDEWIAECYVFVTEVFTGEPIETEEMAPKWFPQDQMPYDKMWESDRTWIPHLLAGNELYHRIIYRDYCLHSIPAITDEYVALSIRS